MSELLKLKEWVTVPKAAEHLSNILQEDVSEADVLRLALDGRLKLSVNFVNRAEAICGKVVPRDQAKSDIWSRKEGVLAPLEVELPDDEIKKGLDDGSLVRLIDIGRSVMLDNGVLELDDKICKLHGVYDLPMIGAEQLDVEHRCQQLTDGPPVTLVCLGGPLVEDHDGQLYQVQEHFSNIENYKDENLAKPYDNPRNYYPARTFPSDGILVVRTSALRAFEQRHSSDKSTSRLPKTPIFGGEQPEIAGRTGGRRQKYNTALQTCINRIVDDIHNTGIRPTIGTMRDWFEQCDAITKSDEGYPKHWESEESDCDDLYIDGQKLVWKDRDARERSISMRSLEPYLKRAKE